MKDKFINVRVNEDLYNAIKSITTNEKITISYIINKLLEKHLFTIIPNKKDSYIARNVERKDIKKVEILLSNEEYAKIKETAELNGNSTMSKEIRYRVLNSIYKDTFLSVKEISAINQTKNEILAIGRNLNQFVRKINKSQQCNLTNEEKEYINNIFPVVKKQISNITDNMEELMKKSENELQTNTISKA